MGGADLEFIYVGDTMCSWCWGFAPTMDALTRHYTIPMRLVNGGLRPGPNARPVDDSMRSYLSHHWNQVAAASGQPFNEAVLANDGWVYDTEYPARAVVTMRSHAPHDEFAWFKRLQRAFYAEGIDITDPTVYAALAAEFDVNVELFLDDLGDETSRLGAWDDFEQAQVLQAQGFPTLLLRNGSEMATITRGYRSFEDIEPHLSAHLSDRYEVEVFLA